MKDAKGYGNTKENINKIKQLVKGLLSQKRENKHISRRIIKEIQLFTGKRTIGVELRSELDFHKKHNSQLIKYYETIKQRTVQQENSLKEAKRYVDLYINQRKDNIKQFDDYDKEIVKMKQVINESVLRYESILNSKTGQIDPSLHKEINELDTKTSNQESKNKKLLSEIERLKKDKESMVQDFILYEKNNTKRIEEFEHNIPILENTLKQCIMITEADEKKKENLTERNMSSRELITNEELKLKLRNEEIENENLLFLYLHYKQKIAQRMTMAQLESRNRKGKCNKTATVLHSARSIHRSVSYSTAMNASMSKSRSISQIY